MKTPETPEQLRAALTTLFPAFEGHIDDDPSLGRRLSFHTLMFDFSPFYGKNSDEFTEQQMRGLAELINLAIAAEGPLENAVCTCFLEGRRLDRHLRAAMVAARARDRHAR